LNVLQVCTFGTEGTRSAIAAAGRGYRSEEYPNGLDVEITQYLSSLIPVERGFLWSISDVINGNVEKDRKPIQAFIDEVEKYPGLLNIIQSIEGIKNKRGQHASGVIFYNKTPFETNAIMRSPNGDLTTQFDLHDSEWLGDVKYDILLTEVCDKIIACVNLLQENDLMEKELTLRQVYNKYLHPAVLDLEDTRLWDALAAGTVLDVFQFNTGVGLATAKQVKPRNPTELTSANALMRLMGEKGKERPLDRYCRIKEDINRWYDEVRERGLSEEEIKVLEPYYLPNYGVPADQESLMLVCLDEKLAHFTLKEANNARKIVAKKHMGEIPILHEKFVSQCPNKNLGEYVWETTMGPQMGYAFARPHALAYSFVGIQTLYLATNFPQIFWNCACLIVNAGGTELLLQIEENDEDDEEETKKKNKTNAYGKIARAIGESKSNGITILPPNINESDLIFKPDLQHNAILYGMKGLTRVGTDLVYQIFKNRPYTSIEDFLTKVKVNKTQMISLIKSGAFDRLYNNNRIEAMNYYLSLIADKKKRITLQNMNMLIEK
jgi:DNA polymerase-3 subunit alpha